jgi:hypothetical protein
VGHKPRGTVSSSDPRVGYELQASCRPILVATFEAPGRSRVRGFVVLFGASDYPEGTGQLCGAAAVPKKWLICGERRSRHCETRPGSCRVLHR